MDDSAALPVFRYHPDPLATGCVTLAPDTPCLGCNRIRGYVYSGAVSTEKNFILENALCPWCIADGTAAKRFGATFNYAGMMENVSPEVRQEIEERTPGFTGWQQETWLACCNDAAAFLGVVGAKELKRDFPEAIPAVKKHIKDDYNLSGADLQEFFDGLTKDDEPSAYLFRCLHYKNYLAYADMA